MKALTHNIQQEREDQRDRSAQLLCGASSFLCTKTTALARPASCGRVTRWTLLRKIPDGHPIRQQQERNGRHEGEPQRHL